MLTTVPAFLCITGVKPGSQFSDLDNQDWLDKLNSQMIDKIYPGEFRYQFRIVYKDTIEECEQMREQHLAQKHQSGYHDWSPVFIHDWSDETLFNQLKINALEFDNNQHHTYKVYNHGMDPKQEIIATASTPGMKGYLQHTYNHLHFDFTFDGWTSSLASQTILAEFDHNLAKHEWDFHTGGEQIAETMMDHLCTDLNGGLSIESIDTFHQVFTDESISSKLVFAFNKRLNSGVLFIGDIHQHIPMIKLQMSVIQALMPWLNTVFTESNVGHLIYDPRDPFLTALNHLGAQRAWNEPLIVCPLRDSSYCHHCSVMTESNFPSINHDVLNQLRHQKIAELPKMKEFEGDPAKEALMEGVDFNDEQSMKNLRWEQQYQCTLSRIHLTSLIRSMVIFNSLNHPRLKPNSLNIAITGASHLADILDAAKERLNEDLLSDPQNIPDVNCLLRYSDN